jgi:hypothetical protein
MTKAFVRTLGELEPEEAKQLDTYAKRADEGSSYQATAFSPREAEVGAARLDHLVTLGLLEYTYSAITDPGFVNLSRGSISDVMFSAFGWAFVQACRAPPPMP